MNFLDIVEYCNEYVTQGMYLQHKRYKTLSWGPVLVHIYLALLYCLHCYNMSVYAPKGFLYICFTFVCLNFVLRLPASLCMYVSTILVHGCNIHVRFACKFLCIACMSVFLEVSVSACPSISARAVYMGVHCTSEHIWWSGCYIAAA